jgi:DNA-binding IclR family transcriptional regulator
VLLAYARDGDLTDPDRTDHLSKVTGTTVTRPAPLRRQLSQVRTRGYATCWQEREVGLCSVAVPLRDYTGKVVGCLTLAGPATRINTRTYQSHLPALRAAAHRIEIHLGGARPTDHPY